MMYCMMIVAILFSAANSNEPEGDVIEIKKTDIAVGDTIVGLTECFLNKTCQSTCSSGSKFRGTWDENEIDKSFAAARLTECCVEYGESSVECEVKAVRTGIRGRVAGGLRTRTTCLPFIRFCKEDLPAQIKALSQSAPVSPNTITDMWWRRAMSGSIEYGTINDIKELRNKGINIVRCLTQEWNDCKFTELPQQTTITGLATCTICKLGQPEAYKLKETKISSHSFYEKCVISCKCGDMDLMEPSYRAMGMPHGALLEDGQVTCWGITNDEYWKNDDEYKIMQLLAGETYTGRPKTYCAPMGCQNKTFKDYHTTEFDNKKVIKVDCEGCVTLKYPEECRITDQVEEGSIRITLQSEVGTYMLKMMSDTRTGDFILDRVELFTIEGPFKTSISGYCNSVIYEREVSFTLDEYCNSKYSGYQWFPFREYCKHDKTIKKSLGVILAVTTAFIARWYLAVGISMLLTLILGSLSLLMRRTLTCPICMKLRLFGRCHRCNPTTCTYCHEVIMSDDIITEKTQSHIREIQLNHFKRCKNMISSSVVFLTYINIFKFFSRVLYNVFSSVLRMSIIGLLIWLMTLVLPGAWAAETLEEAIVKAAEAAEKEHDKNRIILDFTLSLWQKVVLGGLLSFAMLTVVLSVLSPISGALQMFFEAWVLGRRYTCRKCYSYVYDVMTHHCKTYICPSCSTEFGEFGEEERMAVAMHRHVSECTEGTHPNVGLARQYRRRARLNCGVLSLSSLLLAVSMFLILGVVNGDDTYKPDTPVDTLRDDLNWKLPKDPVNFGNLVYEPISVLEQKTICGQGKCATTMVVEALTMARKGRAFGYSMIPKEKFKANVTSQLKFVVKMEDAFTRCQYKTIYRTGKPEHHTNSYKTCKANSDCAYCQKQAAAFKSFDHVTKCVASGWCMQQCEINDPGTNKWSCDGSCLIAGGGGCTCGSCSCYVNELTHTVLKKVSEEPVLRMCYDFGGKVKCSELGRETRSNDITVVKTGDSTNFCPELIVHDGHSYFRGPINDWGEFDNKFGTLQIVAERHSGEKQGENMAGNCFVDWYERCEFGYDAEIKINRCCKDTYDMKDNLEHLDCKVETAMEKIRMYPQDLGTWSIKIKLPDLVYVEEKTVYQISKFEIRDCKGCFKCNEGASCYMEINSNFEVSLNMACLPCTTDKEFIHVAPGLTKVNVNMFCQEKQPIINCTLGGKANATFHADLKEAPKVPHGDSVINVSPGLVESSGDCGFLGCLFDNVGSWFSNLFSGPWAWIKWILMVVVGLVLLWAGVQLVKLMSMVFRSMKVRDDRVKHVVKRDTELGKKNLRRSGWIQDWREKTDEHVA